MSGPRAPRPLAMQAIPPDVLTPGDYQAHAERVLDANAWAYLSSYAGDGLTLRANRLAWDEIALLPRVLRSAAMLDISCTLFGRSWPAPLLVAPMALQRLAHEDGELATAVAASAQACGVVLSSQASLPLETVAQAVAQDPDRGPLWFQLYFLADRGATLDLVRRAEAAGYEALVVTVDAAVRTARSGEQRAGFRLPPGISTVNLPPEAPVAGVRAMAAQGPTWDDIAWLRAQTRLPLLLKGLLHPADLRQAATLEVDGVIVSNHGGRTLDTAAATAHALPAMVEAARGDLPVLVDGGIRRGTDAFKALALGASAVLVGRPILWGLATAGAAGAAHVLRLLRDELEAVMAQCGAGCLTQITTELLLPEKMKESRR